MHDMSRDFWKDFKDHYTEIPSVYQHDVPDWENGLVLIGNQYILLICQGMELTPSCDLQVFILDKEKVKALTLEDFKKCLVSETYDGETEDDYNTLQAIVYSGEETEFFGEIFFKYYDAFRKTIIEAKRYNEVEQTTLDCIEG